MIDQQATSIEYDVFISYRHGGDDQAIAELLHRQLEAFRTPAALVKRGVAGRLARVFRDRDELPTSADLSESIVAALKSSRFLVVVCSPRARQSKWIAKEIELFRAMGKGAQILTLLIDGEPSEAFPENLFEKRIVRVADAQGVVREIEQLSEPLAADIRAENARGVKQLLKTEILRILAPVLGCTFDDLRQRQQARVRQQLIAASAVLATLVAVFSSLAGYALIKRADAITRANSALTYQSRVLALLAGKEHERGEFRRSKALALEGLPLSMDAPDRPLVDEPVAVLRRAVRDDRLLAALSTAPGRPISVGFSPDGKYLVAGTNKKEARVWDAATRASLWTLPTHNDVALSLDFSADSKKVLIGGDQRPRVYDLSSGKLLLELPLHAQNRYVRAAKFAAGDDMIATAGNDNTVKIWNEKSGSLLNTFQGPDFDAVLARMVERGTRSIVDPIMKSVGRATWQIMGATGALAVSPDGRLVATYADAGADPETAVRVFDARSGAPLATLIGHGDRSTEVLMSSINAVKFSPDGSMIVSAGSDKTIRIWDPRTGKQLRSMPFESEVQVLAFDISGRRLAAGSKDGSVRIFDTDTQLVITTFDHRGSEIRGLAISADARFVVSTYADYSVRLNQLRDGSTFAVLLGHRDIIFDLAISPDSQVLATASADGEVRLWRTGEQGLTSLAVTERDDDRRSDVNDNSTVISNDGRLLAQKIGARRFQLFAMDTAQRLGGLHFFESDIKNVGFVAGESHVLVVLGDNRFILIDRSGKAVVTVKAPPEVRDSLSWSADYDPARKVLGVSNGEKTWLIGGDGTLGGILEGTEPLFLNSLTLLTRVPLENRILLWRVPGGQKLIEKTATSPSLTRRGEDGLFVQTADATLYLYGKSWTSVARFEGNNFAVARDADIVATVQGSHVVLFSLSTAREISRVKTQSLFRTMCVAADCGDTIVQNLELTPDGKRIIIAGTQGIVVATPGSDKALKVLETIDVKTSTFRVKTTLSHDGRFILTVRSPQSQSGETKATGSSELTWTVYSAATGGVVGKGTERYNPDGSNEPILSSNGERIFFDHHGVASLVNVSDLNREIIRRTAPVRDYRTLPAFGLQTDLEFCRDGTAIVSRDAGVVSVWNAATGAILAQMEGRAVASQQADGTISIYDTIGLLKTLESKASSQEVAAGSEIFQRKSISLPGNPRKPEIATSGSSGSNVTVDEFQIEGFKTLGFMFGSENFQVASDGTRAVITNTCDASTVSGSDQKKNADCQPWLVDLVGKQKIAVLTVDQMKAGKAKFSANGAILAAALVPIKPDDEQSSTDTQLKQAKSKNIRLGIWDARDGKLTSTITISRAESDRDLPDFEVSGVGNVIIVDSSTPQIFAKETGWRELKLANVSDNDKQPFLSKFRLSPDGGLIAAVADNAVHIWSSRDGKLVSTINEDKSDVAVLALGNSTVAIGTVSGALRVHDSRTGRMVLRQPIGGSFSGLAISADENRIAGLTANGEGFALDVQTATEAETLPASDLIDWARALEVFAMTDEERESFLLAGKAPSIVVKPPRLMPDRTTPDPATFERAVRLALGEDGAPNLTAALGIVLGSKNGQAAEAAFALGAAIEKSRSTPTARQTAFLLYQAGLFWADGQTGDGDLTRGTERANALGHLLPPAEVVQGYRKAQVLGQ